MLERVLRELYMLVAVAVTPGCEVLGDSRRGWRGCMIFPLNMMIVVLNMMNYSLKVTDVLLQIDELCIKNNEFCTQMADFVLKMMNYVLKMTDFGAGDLRHVRRRGHASGQFSMEQS